MHFPVSGIEANPLLLLLAAFAVSALTSPAGVSGAFLLLPFQVSVLGFTSPAISPTNLIYNVVATPDWLLGAVLGLGGLAGSYAGARAQRFLPEAWAKAVLGTLVTLLALSYLYQSLS